MRVRHRRQAEFEAIQLTRERIGRGREVFEREVVEALKAAGAKGSACKLLRTGKVEVGQGFDATIAGEGDWLVVWSPGWIGVFPDELFRARFVPVEE